MPTIAQVSRIVVYGLPLAFVVFSWFASASLPELLERDYTFVSTLQERSSAIETPRGEISMSPRTVDWQRPNGNTSYTQLPSAPRLLHYLLLGAGLRDVSTQTLIISLFGTVLTTVLLWRLFGNPALLVVPLALVLDYASFLSWTLNASRIWMFVVFFGLVFAVKHDRPYWYGALAFCLIQLDFRMAAFVGVTTMTFALLSHKARGLRFVAAGLAGALVPLAIFVLEVLVFYGWDNLVYEFTVGRTWVFSLGSKADSVRFLYEAGHGPILLLWTVASDTHNLTVFVMVVAGIVSSFFALSRGWLSEPHRFLTNLTVSATIGTIVASSLLYASFVDGFVSSTLPLASFTIAPALGALALELQTLLGKAWRSPHVATLTTALVVVPVLLATIVHYEPPIEFQLYRHVQHELRQSPGIGPGVQSFFALPGRPLAQQP